VAAAAGVSLTTVTHALNPPPGTVMREATRERVIEAARKLGYKPRFAGRALVSGKTYAIGLLQPQHRMLAYPIYNRIVHSLASFAEEDDYHLLILPLTESRRWMRPVRQRRVDGTFVLQSHAACEHIDALVEEDLPVVVINTCYAAADDRRCTCVTSDHAAAAQQALAKLRESGCHRAVLLHNPAWSDGNRVLQDAFDNHATDAEDTAAGVLNPSLDTDELRKQVREMLDDVCQGTGFLVDGVERANLLCEELARAGLRPGTDCPVVALCERLRRTPEKHPGMDCLVQDLDRVADEAWGAMHGHLAGRAVPPSVLVPYRTVGL